VAELQQNPQAPIYLEELSPRLHGIKRDTCLRVSESTVHVSTLLGTERAYFSSTQTSIHSLHLCFHQKFSGKTGLMETPAESE